MEYRVGIGYDIHPLVAGRKLFLGGIEIPYVLGLFGHSDGDCLLHALCDALLGAAADGDIGEHFPDTDPKYLDIRSTQLLDKVIDRLTSQGFEISNIDAVLIAQEPSVTPFKKLIQEEIARVCRVSAAMVNVKAKTNQGLGDVGRKEAIAAYVSVLLNRERPV